MPHTSRNSPSRSRGGGRVSEWRLVPFFAFACLMMGADFVAVEAGPLRHLAGGIPLWLEYLPWFAAAMMICFWLLLRRWIGAWGTLLSYLVAIFLLLALVNHTVQARVGSVSLSRELPAEEQEAPEKAVGAQVVQQHSSGKPVQLLFLRDPRLHDRIVDWISTHPH